MSSPGSPRAERAGAQTRRTLALELAGSWQISQLTAESWIAQAERFVEALPLTLSMLADGSLLTHQAPMPTRSLLGSRSSTCSVRTSWPTPMSPSTTRPPASRG